MSRILMIGLLIAGVFSWSSAYALKFVAYGDTRTNQAIHQNVINAIAKENPEFILNVGDLWGEYGQTGFKTVLNANANIGALLTANKYLVSRGNHETWPQCSSFTPTLVRNNKEDYSYTQGNCFFVSMGFDPGLNNPWMDTVLSTQAAKDAKWRFVFAHKPVYSSGTTHGANGTTSEGTSVTNFRALCDKNSVTIFFAGHDHIYERSKLILNGTVVDSSDNIPGTKKGTVYMVSGGGGAPLAAYTTAKPSWSRFRTVTNEYSVIDAQDDSLTVTTKDTTGSVLDQFVIHLPAVGALYLMPKAMYRGSILNVYGNTLALTIDQPQRASLKVFNPLGVLVADHSARCRTMTPGRHSIDLKNNRLTTGLYLVVFNNGASSVSRTMFLGLDPAAR